MIRFTFASAAAMLLPAGFNPAFAATMLVADLTNAGENPPTTPTLTNGEPRPASFGSATLLLNDDATALTLEITVFNIDFTGTQTDDLNDNLTVAHIHGSATVTPETNAGVVWGFIGTPFNDTSPQDVVVTPFQMDVGGTVTAKWDAPEGNNTTLTDQLDNILNGRTYINFHTVQFPGGEIRGHIVVVPEASSLVLAAGGIAMTAARRRRPGNQKSR